MKPLISLPGGAVLAIALAFPPLGFSADDESKPAEAPIPKLRKNDLSPLAATESVSSSHAPYESGDCALCHTNSDAKNPGPITAPVNEQCLGCHDDFLKKISGKTGHIAARESCVSCHNPHNAKQPKLLAAEPASLCLGCHESVKNQATHARVRHDAVTTKDQCANCHNAHGSKVEKLLIQMPMKLCLSCHGDEEALDHDGRRLTNMKALIEGSRVRHGPVASEDCSACHNPHGNPNFRLLTQEYPATFYSGFDSKLYALCFECHEERMITEAQTKNETRFRNGTTNLHYLHVNKVERGRTCRACHEVHAANQNHLIRESVPYGPKAWPLKLNYTATATGGSCAKTCHATRSYDRNNPVEEKK